ncbi:MAG: VOC family protein [Anaerolineae bacterium]|nr:VOC family protein [Anaerolineae bacterium]
MSLPSTTHIGSVALTVADLPRSLRFYTEVLGFQVQAESDFTASLAAAGTPALVELTARPAARPKPARSTGLYHFAVLVPTRQDLACVLRRLVQADWPLQGVADHGVSEALYLADPDGNGVEVYADRPRDTWPVRSGRLQMFTEPLDLGDLLKELDRDRRPWPGLPQGTCIGHVHLHVADLAEAERFYCGALGFDLMQRYGPSALFVSAGGYHHHVGLNTWAGVGAPPPPADAAGLRHFTVVLPDEAALAAVLRRLEAAGRPAEPGADGWYVADPSANRVRLAMAAAPPPYGDHI